MHLAIGLEVEALTKRYSVSFITADDFICIMQDKIPSKCKLKFQHPSVI